MPSDSLDDDYEYDFDAAGGDGGGGGNQVEEAPPQTSSAPSNEKIVKITQNVNAANNKKTKNEQQALAAQDTKLKQFLSNADEIESIEHFTYWKDEFLKAFRKYLNPLGTATAREADEDIYFQLEQLAQICLDVKAMILQGNITAERSTVKGQRSINEMISKLASVETQITAYWPKTQEEEEVQCGYTKFELAAVLVRDGFRVYGLMVATRDYVQSLSQGPLQDVLKSNQLSIIQYYFRCIDSFAETMADLGMFKLMTTCVDIYKVRPRKKKKQHKFDKTSSGKDALSDSSDSDDANKGRLFQKAKFNTKSIIDRGWRSSVTGQEEATPWDPDGKTLGGNGKPPKKPAGYGKNKWTDDDEDENEQAKHGGAKDQESDDDEDQEEVVVDFIYCFDPVLEAVFKVPRAACIAEQVIYSTVDKKTGKEMAEGLIEEWESSNEDGNAASTTTTMGKTEVIWKLKELLRGKAKKKAEGLASPPNSPKKKSAASKA